MKYCSKQSVSSGRTLHYIKLFEKFNSDYIINSIKDIFIELQDDSMEVDVIDRRDYNNEILVRIKGKSNEKILSSPSLIIDIPYDAYDEFNYEKIEDYVDMLKDFLDDCIEYKLYFELFDEDGNCINRNTEKVDFDKVGSVNIHITDIKEI